jgi:hypothetical protein
MVDGTIVREGIQSSVLEGIRLSVSRCDSWQKLKYWQQAKEAHGNNPHHSGYVSSGLQRAIIMHMIVRRLRDEQGRSNIELFKSFGRLELP